MTNKISSWPKEEREKINRMVNLLYLSDYDLDTVCQENEIDLAPEEIEKLYSILFKCEKCGIWDEVGTIEFSNDYGAICPDCYYRELEEEEEEED